MPMAAYSLVEMLVTLAVSAILLAAAVPSLRHVMSSARMSAAIDQLMSDIQLARIVAIKRNGDVVLCRSSSGRQCLRSHRIHTKWSMGWIIFADVDEDGSRDPGEPLLGVRPGLPPGMDLRFNQWWRLAYHGDGSAKNGTFTLCDSRGSTAARALVVFYTGRPRVATAQPDGEPLDCP